MKGLKGREMKTVFLSIRHYERKRASVVIFAVFPMLMMFLLPVQASRNVTRAFIDDFSDLAGVKVGDWVKYSLSTTGPVWSGERDLDWIKIDVQNVSGTVVTVHERIHSKNDPPEFNNTVTITADLKMESVGLFIIATNLCVGDRVHTEGLEDSFINSTASKMYLGVNREAFYSMFSFTMPFFWDYVNGTKERYWDRETGFLLEDRNEGFLVDYENTTFSTWLMKIADTNLWETKINTQPQPVSRQLELLAFTSAVAGTVTVVTFLKRRPRTNKKSSEV